MAEQQEIQSRALAKARGGESTCNHRTIVNGFIAMGVAADEILPRTNLLTSHDWRALGFGVIKRQLGVKVATLIQVAKTEADTGEKKGHSMLRMTPVLHVSQTVELGALKS